MPGKLNLLLLEDDKEDADLIRKALERSGLNFDLAVISTEKSFLAELRKDVYDLVMTDNRLPQFNAIGALQIINDLKIKIPCIVVTGTASDELAVELMKKGACDYIMKDRLSRLPNSIINAVKNSRLEKADQKKLADIIKHRELMKEAEALAHFGSWENDLINNVSYWSDETFRILGYEPGEVTPSASKLMARIHPDDLRQVKKIVDDAKNHLHNIKYSFRIAPQPDAILKYVTAEMFITRDPTGNIIRTRGLIQDVTERKIAEEKIIAAEKKYRNLFENTPVPMWVIDEQTFQIKTVNNAAINNYGYTYAEFISLTTLDIRPEGEKEKYLSIDRSKERFGNIGVWKHKKKDGSIIDVEIIVDTIIYDEQKCMLVMANDITERTKADVILKHTTQRLKQAQEIAHIGSWEHDLVSKNLIWSDEMYRIYGLSPDDDILDFQKFTKYIHPEDLEYVLRQINTSRAELTGTSYHHRIVRENGKVRHVHAQFEYEFDSNGTPIARFGVVQDVTDITIAENKLRHTALGLEQAQAIAHIGSWEHDLKTGIAEWSPETCRIFGISPFDTQQSLEVYLSFIHPDDLGNTRKKIKEAHETICSVSIQQRIIRKDGEIRHIFTQAEFQLDATGKPLTIHGIVHDVTDIRESQLALVQSEANLRLIMDLLPQTVSVRNFAGEFLFANKSFASLYGLNPEKLIGSTIRNMIPAGNDPEEYLLRDQTVITNNDIRVMPEATITDYKGTQKTFSITKLPFTPAGQKERSVLGIGYDITEQKTLEVERMKMLEDIVQRNKDLEQFSYIVSHNLRAPVANLLGITSLLDNGELTNDEYSFLMTGLTNCVKKLDDVIIDLNQITQVRHSVNERKEEVIFFHLVTNILTSIGNPANNTDIFINTDFDEIGKFNTVNNYIHSIFYNLITNSIKYKKPNVPLICEIKSRKLKNTLQLTFKDNGMGIDLEKSGDQIFELYKRFHVGAAEGKGMGLFMVKTHVESLGGKISVFSKINQGTQFTIELPLTEPSR